MGAGQSISSGFPSRDIYTKKVIPAHYVVNDIFRWMLNEVEFHDLLDLTSQHKCQSYIFLTKKALSVFFREIQLDPRMGKEDALYFQSVKHLQYADEQTRKQHPDEVAFRDTVCRQLAFFYVRIFQVFGALALTVFDGLPEIGSSVAPQVRADQHRSPLFGLQGGARSHVERVDEQPQDMDSTMFKLTQGMLYRIHRSKGFYLISENPVSRDTMVDISTDVGVVFYVPSQQNLIVYREYDKTLYANILVSEVSDGIELRVPQYSIVRPGTDMKSSQISHLFTSEFGAYTYKNRKLPSDIRDIFAQVFKRAGVQQPMWGAPQPYVQQPYALQPQHRADMWGAQQPFAQQPQQRRAVAWGAQPHKAVGFEPQGATTGLSWEMLYGIMEGKQAQPKAYCIARAIQLLSPTFQDTASTPTSRICFFTEIPGLKESLPLYDKPIREHNPGIRALDQLFYDMIDGNMPKISDAVRPKYTQFVQLLQDIHSPEGKRVTNTSVDKLDKVVSYPFSQCKPYKNQPILVQNKATLQKVRTQVAELLQTQVAHTANVMKFVQSMFLFGKDGRIAGIHPVLQKGGIAAVNVLADKARALLIEYYKQCEVHFRIGASHIAAGMPAAPATQGVPQQQQFVV